MSLVSIQEVVRTLRGKKVLVRLDLNVPIVNGHVRDDFRIQKVLPTLDLLRKGGAKILLISHTESGDSKTLRPMFDSINTRFKIEHFIEDILSSHASETIKNLKDGEAVLFENIRQYEGEKKNDETFAKNLAWTSDVYVNEAFAVSHREHASVVGVPKFLPSYAGLLFVEEMRGLSQALKPTHPALFVLGGAKFETKFPLIEKFMKLYDFVFICGALSNDFFKAQGYSVGKSMVSETSLDLKEMLADKKLYLPPDVIVQTSTIVADKKPSEVLDTDKIMDAGVKSLDVLKKLLEKSKSVLWNGPLGAYEDGFQEPTMNLAKMISQSSLHSIVGGGDTLAAIASMGIQNDFDFVSTGGGAMLDFLAKETLPGIEALKKSPEAKR